MNLTCPVEFSTENTASTVENSTGCPVEFLEKHCFNSGKLNWTSKSGTATGPIQWLSGWLVVRWTPSHRPNHSVLEWLQYLYSWKWARKYPLGLVLTHIRNYYEYCSLMLATVMRYLYLVVTTCRSISGEVSMLPLRDL